MGKGLAGLAAQTRSVQAGAPVFKEVKQTGADPTAVIAAPMLVEEELIGVITAVSFRPRKRFTSADALLYSRLAAIAGLVVDQQQQLDAIAERKQRRQVFRPLKEKQRKIVDSAVRLATANPRKLDQISELLVLVERLAK